jgi:hypothetical protein
MNADDTPIREPDQIRQDCARKLREVQVSEHFEAILGCLLGGDWTAPRLVEMIIAPDGHLLGRCDGEASFKAFLGASEDLLRNIHGVAAVAELDGVELGYLVAKVAEIKRQMQKGASHVDFHQTRFLQFALRDPMRFSSSSLISRSYRLSRSRPLENLGIKRQTGKYCL